VKVETGIEKETPFEWPNHMISKEEVKSNFEQWIKTRKEEFKRLESFNQDETTLNLIKLFDEYQIAHGITNGSGNKSSFQNFYHLFSSNNDTLFIRRALWVSKWNKPNNNKKIYFCTDEKLKIGNHSFIFDYNSSEVDNIQTGNEMKSHNFEIWVSSLDEFVD